MYKNRIFADLISESKYVGGTVRMKLAAITAVEDGKVSHEEVAELVTGLDGFVDCFLSMKELMEKFVASGLIKDSVFDRVVEKDAPLPDPAKPANN